MMVRENWWEDVSEGELSQGDFLRDCTIPIIPSTFDSTPGSESDISIEERNVIVLTQSCDLMQNKAPLVALCPIYSLDEWAAENTKFLKFKEWETVRKGKIEGLHMLSSFDGPADNKNSFVVDFRQIYSLPVEYLRKVAQSQGLRKRLISPYLEHFAQAFARFFMRVGLPSAIEPFRN